MTQNTNSRRMGSIRVTLLVSSLLAISGGILYGYRQYTGLEADRFANALTLPVFEGEFVAAVNEAGELESSSNIEIRCRVKSSGREGSTILNVVPEGTVVESGDYLCQLDDSLLQELLTEQRIQVARDQAAVKQAESDLATAKGMLTEYVEGVYKQELAAIEAEIAVAQEGKKRAEEYLRHSSMLNRKGYVTRTQLEADEFAVQKSLLDYELAVSKKVVYETYTRTRMEEQYQLEIEKQQSNLDAANFTLELSQQREEEITQQIANCRLTAPARGTVIYANDVDRDGDSSFVIEEGAVVRDGQPIFFLPDPTRMQVRAKVNESKISRVKPGQEVKIRLDSNPDEAFRGEVRSVAAYPLPRRWSQAPVEYEVIVRVTEVTEKVRAGLRTKVEILTEQIASARQAPITAVIPHENERYVLVKKGTSVEPRKVETGSNNDRFVIISAGLEPGEEVLIDPESYRDLVTFPERPSSDSPKAEATP